MFPTKVSQLLIAVTIISAVGCSGSRLRNMITRSDYKSLEQIEAQDSVKEAREAADREKALVADGSANYGEKLASQEREIDEATDAVSPEETKKKRGFLNLAGLLNRDVDEEDISPDPFLNNNTTNNVSEKNAVANANEKTEREDVKLAETKTAAKTAEEYVSEKPGIAADTAEEVFRSIAAKDDTEKPTESVAAAAEKSFADFIAEQNKKAKSEFEAKVAEAAEPIIRPEDAQQVTEKPSMEVADTLDAFDELLGAAGASATTKQTEAGPSDDLVPGLDELLAESAASAPDEVEAASVATVDTERKTPLDEFFAEESTSNDSAVAASNPFAETAAIDESVPAAEESDPWAAFRENQHVSTVQSAANAFPSDSQQFNWAEQPAAEEQVKSKAASPFNSATTTTASFTNSDDSSAFRNASSTSDAASGLQAPLSGGLVIPAGATQQVAFSTEETQASNPPIFDEQQIDPFAESESAVSGDDLFEQADDELFAAVTTDVAASTIESPTGMSSFQGWSTRTWFFLLGCIIVALVLFMPERQKRSNP